MKRRNGSKLVPTWSKWLFGGIIGVVLGLVLFTTIRSLSDGRAARTKIEHLRLFEKSRREAKTQALGPFLEAVKNALREGSKLNSSVELGVGYQIYNEQMVEFATIVKSVTTEMDLANVEALIPKASDICKYLSESMRHYAKAKDHWQTKIFRQDVPKTEKKIQLEWIAASESIRIADICFRLVVSNQSQENKPGENEDYSEMSQRLDSEQVSHLAVLTSCNKQLEDLEKYGYSENESARIISYLDEIVSNARKISEAREQLVIDPAREPIERKFQRRREAITAPLDALKDALKATEDEAKNKLQKADEDLINAKARAYQSPLESEILRRAEDAHMDIKAEQNEAIEIIQKSIQEELDSLR